MSQLTLTPHGVCVNNISRFGNLHVERLWRQLSGQRIYNTSMRENESSDSKATQHQEGLAAACNSSLLWWSWNPQSKLASKTSHISKFWIWLRDAASVHEAEGQQRMTPNINNGVHSYVCKTCVHMHALHTCKHMHKEEICHKTYLEWQITCKLVLKRIVDTQYMTP